MRSTPLNATLIGLFVSISVAILMGFVIQAQLEKLHLSEITSSLQKSIDAKIPQAAGSEATLSNASFDELHLIDPLIVGMLLINGSGTIIHSYEPSLLGKQFSDQSRIKKALEIGSYYAIDRNLISQETRPKEEYKALMIHYYHRPGADYVFQILYDLSPLQEKFGWVISLIWFTILFSVGVLFAALLLISKLLQRTLQLAKDALEAEVRSRTKELEELSTSLEKQVKGRTTELEATNKTLLEKSISLNETKGQLEDKNFELEQANEEIVRLLKAKNDFVNRSAHDLRTPITPILALLPSIRMRIKDQAILHDLAIVEKNAHYLKLLADDLIILIKSSKKTSSYTFKKRDIKKILEQVLSVNRQLFSNRRIRVEKHFQKNLPLAEIDELRMEEVLQNIISNAAKFMPNGGILKASISKTENLLNVRIQDSGIGMSQDTQKKLFQEFFKADTSRHNEGSGLGLAISKEIIKNHNGEMWAESKGMGKGSAMCFKIPLRQKGEEK